MILPKERHYPTNPCRYAKEIFWDETASGEEISFFQCGHPDHQTEGTYRFNQNECKNCKKSIEARIHL